MLKLRPPGLKSMVGCCGQQTRQHHIYESLWKMA
jgi:hypothetical protein